MPFILLLSLSTYTAGHFVVHPSPRPAPPFIITQSYTVPGNFSFTVPQGVTSITIEAWGGGGRGGSKNSGTDGTGGGGGGAYSRDIITVTPGESFVINVGAGSSSNSVDGGDSWISPGTVGQAILLARGGKTVPTNGVDGGEGGRADEGVGAIRFSGGNGANRAGITISGGGGSSGGTDADGTSAVNQTGGVAPAGGGNGANGRTAPASGLPGQAPGGGGGGAVRGDSGSPAGGNGGRGQVVITYTYVADAGIDIIQCKNSLFSLQAPVPPVGFDVNWTVVSGTALLYNPASLATTVSVPEGMAATIRLTVTDGTTVVTDDVVLTNQSSCGSTCTDPFNLNGNLENEGTADGYSLSFQGTPATLIQNNENPEGWSSHYRGNNPNTSSFTGAYYLKKTGSNGDPLSGSGFLYLGGNGFGVSAFESKDHTQCGRTYRISANVAAYSNAATQANSPFVMALSATGSQVTNFFHAQYITAPASNSWNDLNWQRYSFEVTIPSSGYTLADVLFISLSNTNGIVIDDVCVEDVSAGSAAFAGDDIFQCDNVFNLAANETSGNYSGNWSVVAGNATLSNPGSHQTQATITSGDAARLRWTVNGSGAQNTITLIDPNKEGGFEEGTSFSANGWTVVNQFWNRWAMGAVGGVTSGGSAAYMTNAWSGGHSYLTGVNQTVHFYRDVVIHPDASDINLSFKWKSMGESGHDRILVYTAPTGVTPSGGSPSSPSTALSGATLVSSFNLHSSNNFQTSQIMLPASLAGTTVRLIFTWQNDGSSGLQPPAVIDEISLTHNVPLCSGFDDIVIGYNPSSFSVTRDTICAGDTAMVTANGCTNGTLLWSTGETTSSVQIAPLATTTYSVTCTPDIPTNILLNQGFESASDLQFWTASGQPVSITTNTPDVQEGLRAAVLNGTNGLSTLSQPVDVVPGERYILKVWAKTTNTNGNPKIKHQLYSSGWSQLLFNEAGKRIESSLYQEYTVEFVIPPGAAHLLISAEVEGGLLYVDNWSLHKYTECVAVASTQVVVHPLPASPVVSSVVQPTCIVPTGTITLGGLPAAGNWVITRQPGNVQINGNGTTSIVSGFAPNSTYTFWVTNVNGCTSADPLEVYIQPIPTDPVLGGDSHTCVGTQANMTPSVGGVWTSSNTGIATITNAGLVTGITPGNVLFTYTRNSDGCDQTISFDVFSNPAVPFIGPVVHPTCITPSGSVILQNLPNTGNWTITRLPDGFTYQGSGIQFTATGIPPDGTYQFFVEDQNGCVSPVSANVYIQPIPADPVLSGVEHGCVGAVSQVFPNNNGMWTTSDPNIATIQNNGAVTGINPGTVQLTYTRTADGCDAVKNFTIYANPEPPVVDTIIQPTCIVPTGTIYLEGLPGGFPWSMVITPGGQSYVDSSSTFTISGLAPATDFSFQVTDHRGCISAFSIPASVLPIPYDPVLGGDTVVCTGSMAQVLPSLAGVWSSSNTSIAVVNNNGEVTGTGAGVVTLTYIRNSDGCQSSKSFEVYSNPLAPIVGFITQPTCITPTGSVELSGLPVSGNWTLTATPGNQTYSGSGLEYTVTLLDTSTTYTFTVTDHHGCVSLVSANVVINAIPANPVLSGDTLLCLSGEGIFFPNTAGVWTSQNNMIATITANGVATGISEGMASFTYTRNSDGCAQTLLVPVYPLPAFPVIDEITQPTCIVPSGSVVLQSLPVNGPWTIRIFPGNTEIQGNGASYEVNNLPPDDMYTFDVTDFRGCTSEVSSDVFIFPIPDDPVIEGDTFICIGATTVLEPSAGGIWTSDNPTVATIDNDGLLTGIGAGPVNLTFTRTVDGCNSTIVFTVQPLPVAPGVGDITQPTCLVPTGSVELIALPDQGDWIISRSPGDTLYMDSGTSVLITDLPPGETYTFSVVNQYNCLSVPSADVVVLPIPDDPVLAGSSEACEGVESQVLPATGGTWTSGNPAVASVTPAGLVNASSDGTVELTFTRQGDGCSSTVFFTVHPAPETNLVAPEVCQDSTLIITNSPYTGLPGYTYIWSGPNGFTATSQHVNREGSFLSMSGKYCVTITDSRGCIGKDSIIGTVNPRATYSASVTDVTIFNGNNGSIDLTLTGGTPPFTYIWSNGATTQDLTNLSNGLYVVTITDSKSCRIINQPEFSVGHPADCSGFRTQTQGGWGSTASGGNPGAYRDANFAAAFPSGLEIGCTNKLRLTTSAAVRDYLPCGGSAGLLPAGTLTNPDCINNVFTGQLIAATLSTTFDLYDPDFGSSDENLINLRISSGPFFRMSVGQLLTEANNLIGGCGSAFTTSQMVTALTSVNENYVDGKVTGSYLRCCQINLTTTGGTICSGNSITISAVASNGIAPYTYAWSDGLGSGASKLVSPTSTKTYTVTVTDDLGCTKTATVTVNVNPTPIVTISAPAVCQGSTLVITPFVNSGTPSFTYRWTGPNSFSSTASVISRSSSTVSMSGSYFVTVTDSRGCSATATGTATVNPNPTSPLIGTITNPLCVPPTGSVTLNGLPSVGTWTITSSPSTTVYTGSGTSFTISGLAPSTTYRFRVTNQNSCSSALSANATIGPIPADPQVGGNTLSCVGGTTFLEPAINGTWSSSNPSVASVTNDGIVTAVNPGTTILTYTRSNDGCDNAMLYTVFANPVAPVIDNVIQPTCYVPTGSIILSGLPNTGFWTVVRYPGAIPYAGSGTNLTINGLPIESSYTFSVVNADFCSSGISASAIIQGMPANPVLSGPSAICTGATANFLPNTGGTWSSSNPAVATINNLGEVFAVAPGTVTFTYIRTSDGCQNSITLTVHPNPGTPLIGTIIQPTCTNPTGTIHLSGLPTDAPWTLTRFPDNDQVTGSGPEYIMENVPPGQTYTFIVRNGFVCASVASANAVINDIPADPVLSGDDEVCIGGTAQVYPDTDGTWSTSNPTIATISNAGLISGVGAGLVEFTYTRDADGCDATRFFNVRIVPNVPFIGTTIQPTCTTPSGSVTLGNLPPVGTWTLTMYPGGQIISGTGTSYLLSGLPPSGSYYFSVANTFDCTSGFSANAIIQAIPLNPALSGDSMVCVGQTANVLPSEGGSWSSADPSVATITTEGWVTGISYGQTELTYTRTSDGCDSTMLFTVNENPSSPLISSLTQPTCTEPFGSVLLEGLPQYGSWSVVRTPGNVVYQGSGPELLIQNLPPATTYTFTVIDIFDCGSLQSIDVVIDDIPADPVLGGEDHICVGQTALVTPETGGSWSSSNTNIATINQQGQVTGVAPGLVTLTFVRTSDGCDAQKDFSVYSVPPAPFLGTITQPTCIDPTGKIWLENLPSTGNWTITIQPGGTQINGSGTQHQVTNLSPDTHYTFTITSEEDCSSVSSTSVHIQPIPSDPVLGGDEYVCVDAEIQLTPDTGGTWISSDPAVAVVDQNGVVTGLQPGNATMTYTRSSDGCLYSKVIEIKELPSVPVVAQVEQPTCLVPFGTVWFENLPLNGSWTIVRDPENTAIAGSGEDFILSGLSYDQTYQFKVVDQFGCGSSFTLPVVIDSIPQNPVLGGLNTVCLGGTSQMSPAAGGVWESSEPLLIQVDNNGFVTSLEAGSAVLTFTRDADGCSNSTNFYVNPNPVANITGQPVFCDNSFGILEGTGGVIYQWSTGATTPVILVQNSGTYYLTITNSFGCIDSTSIETTISSGLTAEIDYLGSVCFEPGKEISAIVYDGIPPYTYQWSGPNGMTSVGQTIIVGENGNYYLTVTDAAGCTAITQGYIHQAYEPLVVTLNTSVCEGQPVNLQVNSTTAVAYQWDNGAGNATTPEVTVYPSFPSSTYLVTVTNDLGCTAVPEIEIQVLEKPEITLDGPQVICIGDTTLFISNHSGSWFSLNPVIASINNYGFVTGVSAGEAKFLFISDQNMCGSDTSILITVQELPLATIVGPQVICEQNYTQALPNTGGTWISSDPGVAIIDNEGQILGLSTGIANFTFTKFSTGCISEPTQDITVTESMALNIRGPLEVCIGSLIVLRPNVEGGVWTSSDTSLATINNSGIVTSHDVGTVTFTYQFQTANCVFTTSHQLTILPKPMILFSGDTTVCVGEQTNLQPDSNGFWMSLNPDVATIDQNGIVSTHQAGLTSFVYISDLSGCQSDPSQILTVHSLPYIELDGNGDICSGSVLTLNAPSAGVWTSSDPIVATVDTQGLVEGLQPGTTWLSFTDEVTGCTAENSIEIIVHDNPSVSIDYNGSICLTDNSLLTAIPVGGNPGYSYTWSGPSGFSGNTQSVFIESNGSYFVTVTDNTGCTAVASGFVYERFEPVITGFGTAVCEGDSLTLTVSANQAASFLWSSNAGNSTQQTIHVVPAVPASVYTVSVTNHLGCVVVTQANITVHSKPVVSIAGPDSICIGEETYVQPVTGGTWVSLYPGIVSVTNAGIITGLSEGITRFIFTDSGTGCISDTSSILTVNAPTPTGLNGPDELCIGETTQLTPGTGGMWFSQHPAVAQVDPSGQVTAISGGVALMSFINDKGCLTNGNISVTVHNTPEIILYGDDQICVGTTTTLLPSAGGTWISTNPSVASVSNVGVVTGLSEGQAAFIYTYTLTGCSSEISQPVFVNDSIDIEIIGSPEICVGATTQLSPTTNGLWISNMPDIAGISPSGEVTALQPGTVTFTYISNAVQCFAGTSSPVTIHPLPVAQLTGESALCTGETSGASASGTGYWVSTNPAVASIDANGLITALSPGSAQFIFTDTITHCSSNPTLPVTVSQSPVASITGVSLVCQGGTTTVSPSTGGNWISTNESVAVVSSSGIVTGIQPGFARFIFVEGGSGCASEPTDTVTIEAKPVLSYAGENEICTGDTTSLFTTTEYGSWTSLQPSVASVDANGTVTGLTGGVARFVFSSQNGCVSDPSEWLTVHEKPVTYLTGVSSVCPGGETYFSPVSGGTWTSENETIAEINQSGVVTAIDAGNVRFIYTDTVTGCSSLFTEWLTVYENPVVSVQGRTAICVGQTTQLSPSSGGQWVSLNPTIAGVNSFGQVNGLSGGTADFRFTNSATGCSADLTNLVIVHALPTLSLDGPSVICTGNQTQVLPSSGGTWTSLHPTIANINQNGVVTGLNPGTARFRFTDASTGCASSTEFQVSVQPAPVISLNGPSVICIGETTQLLPATGGTWSSTDTTIAVINQEGLVTARSSGAVQFIFTSETNGCSSALSPVVTIHPDAMLQLTGPSDVCIGYQTQLSTSLAGVWHSDEPNIAGISVSGLVTGLAPGKANFYFIESATGCRTNFPEDMISVNNCMDPDMNVTFTSTTVTGKLQTNDEVPSAVTYQNNPVLISKPEGAFASLTVQADGSYSFVANLPGKYRYMVQACMYGVSVNCPQFPLTILVADPDKLDHCLIVNTDLISIYKNETASHPVLLNDGCINSTGCSIDPSLVDILEQPMYGSAQFDADNKLEYTPDQHFVGSDTIVYRICDDATLTRCQTARLVIVVKDTDADVSLVATDDFYFMNKNTRLDSLLVTANDMSPENSPFTITSEGTPSLPVQFSKGSYYITEDGYLSFRPADNYVGPVDIVYEICDTSGYCVKATAHILVLDNLKIKVRAYLEGALVENGDQRGPDNRPLMRDGLRFNVHTNSPSLPTYDPYSYPTDYFDVSGSYKHVGAGALIENRHIADPTQVFSVTGADAIVDWVFVELRSVADSTEVLATRSGLIQRDGDIVDLDGISDLQFPGIRVDSCYIVVKHRNHFDVMSRKVPTFVLMDFTRTDAPVFDFGTSLQDGYDYTGTALKPDVVPGYMSMWAGDFDNNGKLKFVNPNDDQNLLFFEVLTYPANEGFVANYNFGHGYFQGDVDMNGKVKYDNPDDDKNYLFYQILFHPLNASFISNFNGIIEQVPPAKE